jgi:hypothetical protein
VGPDAITAHLLEHVPYPGRAERTAGPSWFRRLVRALATPRRARA